MAVSKLDQLKNNQQRALDRGLTDRASTIGQTIDKLSMPTISTGTNKVIDANPTFKQKTVTLPQDRMSPISPTPTNPVTTFGAPKTQITENDLIWKAYNNQRLSREELDFAVEQEKKRQEAQKATLQSTGYQDAINLANKQAADAEANRASQEQLIRDRENAARTTGYQRIDEAAQLQQDLARQQGQERQNQQQQAYSFSGFGRSTANARALDKIAVDTSRQVQTLEAARQAQKTLLDAELRGASDEEIKALSQNVSSLQAKAKEIEIAALANIAELNQQNQVTGAEALQNILKVYGQVNPEGAADIDAAASKGVGYLIRKDGTAVTGADGEPIKFAEAESTSYTGDVGQWQQAIKSGAIPPGTSFDDWQKKYGENAGVVTSSLLSSIPKDIRGDVTQVANQFKTEPQVQNFQVVQEGKSYIDSIDSNNHTPSDDQGMIYAFAKIMDPNSVVREGEYATIQKYAQSWLDSFGFNAQRIIDNKEFLTTEAIDNMKKTVESRYKASEKTYDRIKNEYIRSIDSLAGISVGDQLLRDYRYAKELPQQTSLKQQVKQYVDSLAPEEKAVLQKQFEQVINDPIFDNASEDDIYSYLADKWKIGQSPGFNSVGSDTHAAAPLPPKNGVEAWKTLFGTQSTPTTILNGMKVITKAVAPNLQKLADNCVFFARSIVPNIPTGATSVAGRKEGIKKAEEGGYGGFGGVGAKVGDAIHTSEGNVGHSAVIVDETPTQWILKEANYKSGQITKGRAINKDDPKIIGWISPAKTPVKNNPQEGKNKAIMVQMQLFS